MTPDERKERDRARWRAYDAANRDKRRARNVAYHAANRDAILARQAERRRMAGEQDAARKRRWRKEHPQEAKEKQAAYYYSLPQDVRRAKIKYWNAKYADRRRDWTERNKARLANLAAVWARANMVKKLAAGAKRRAEKLRATPRWADLKAIQMIYADAARLTRETGITHEVDHIVPLQHTHVCGLHVAHNLQVLTRTANRQKANRFDSTQTCITPGLDMDMTR